LFFAWFKAFSLSIKYYISTIWFCMKRDFA
jgi:hypothetical protein